MTNASMLIVGALVACALTIPGCAEAVSPGPPIGTGYIWPLAVGNMWVFDIQEYDSTGALLMSYVDSTIVTDTITVAGVKWYFLEGYMNGYFRNSRDGLVIGDPPYSEFLFLKYPANVGDSTIVAGSYPIVITSLDESLVVKGQPKSAYVYEHRPPHSNAQITTEYSVPNLGRVKLTSMDRHRTHTLYNLTLIDYTLH